MKKLFEDDVAIYGNFARIIKKFSSSSDSEDESWKISDGDGSATVQKPFGTYVDCLFAGAAIGLEKNTKIKQTEFSPAEKKMKASILLSALKARLQEFTHLYQLMILTDPDLGLSKEERAKKAFDEVPESMVDNEFNYFLSFAYGGLVKMEKMFDQVHDYKEFSVLLSEIALEYQGDEE
jgi:hypothetical protein